MTNNQETIADFIRQKRTRMGLSYGDFATLLGLNPGGERTVRGWENGEHKPTPTKLHKIKKLTESMPFKDTGSSHNFKFIDLFAGIGGIRLPFQKLGGKCVFTSEFDKFAQQTYAANFGEVPSGDITEIDASSIPDHDLLLGGFPCQAFSQAGLKKGFNDTRGTMFFEIQRILVEKRPKAFLLENVKTLQSHDKKQTFKTILDILQGDNRPEIPHGAIPLTDSAKEALLIPLNYKVYYKVLRAADFGIPQNRQRIFIIGFDRDYFGDSCHLEAFFKWPEAPKSPTLVGDILEENISDLEKFTISDNLWNGHQRRKLEHKEKGNGFGYSLVNQSSAYTNTLSARYYKDGSEILIDQSHLGKNPRKLTPRECANLQGFPSDFIVDAVSSCQIYKQFGNSVCVPVIESVAKEIYRTMATYSPSNQIT